MNLDNTESLPKEQTNTRTLMLRQTTEEKKRKKKKEKKKGKEGESDVRYPMADCRINR